MQKAFFNILLIILFTSPSLFAEDKNTNKKTQQCIKLNNIRSTPVIDNKTILVELTGRKFKRIDLMNRCPGLKIEGGFSYSTSINKLCIQDSLRVLNSGGICMIDKIVDISKEQAKSLRKRS